MFVAQYSSIRNAVAKRFKVILLSALSYTGFNSFNRLSINCPMSPRSMLQRRLAHYPNRYAFRVIDQSDAAIIR